MQVSVSARSNSNRYRYEFVCMYEDLSRSEVRLHRLYDWMGLLYFVDNDYYITNTCSCQYIIECMFLVLQKNKLPPCRYILAAYVREI